MHLPEHKRKLFEDPDLFHMDCCEIAADVQLLSWASQRLWTDTDGTPDHASGARFAIVCMEIIQVWMKQLDDAAARMDQIVPAEHTANASDARHRNAHC